MTLGRHRQAWVSTQTGPCAHWVTLSKGHHFPRPLWQHLLKGRGIMPTSGATGIGKDPSRVLCVGLSLGPSTRESHTGVGSGLECLAYPSCYCLSTFFPMFILSK